MHTSPAEIKASARCAEKRSQTFCETIDLSPAASGAENPSGGKRRAGVWITFAAALLLTAAFAAFMQTARERAMERAVALNFAGAAAAIPPRV